MRPNDLRNGAIVMVDGWSEVIEPFQVHPYPSSEHDYRVRLRHRGRANYLLWGGAVVSDHAYDLDADDPGGANSPRNLLTIRSYWEHKGMPTFYENPAAP